MSVFPAIDPTIIDCPQGQAASWLRPTGNLICGPHVGGLAGVLSDSLGTTLRRNQVKNVVLLTMVVDGCQ